MLIKKENILIQGVPFSDTSINVLLTFEFGRDILILKMTIFDVSIYIENEPVLVGSLSLSLNNLIKQSAASNTGLECIFRLSHLKWWWYSYWLLSQLKGCLKWKHITVNWLNVFIIKIVPPFIFLIICWRLFKPYAYSFSKWILWRVMTA